MIFGAQIGILVYGLFILIKGEMSMGGGEFLRGWAARLCGLLCFIPIPLGAVLGFGYGIYLGVKGVTESQLKEEYIWHFAGMEVVVLIAVYFLVTITAKLLYKMQSS